MLYSTSFHRYSHNNKSIHTVPIEIVLPLGGDSDPSSDSEGDQDDPEDDFVPETLLDRIHGMRRPIWRYLVVDLGSFRIHSYSAVGCNRRLQK